MEGGTLHGFVFGPKAGLSGLFSRGGRGLHARAIYGQLAIPTNSNCLKVAKPAVNSRDPVSARITNKMCKPMTYKLYECGPPAPNKDAGRPCRYQFSLKSVAVSAEIKYRKPCGNKGVTCTPGG